MILIAMIRLLFLEVLSIRAKHLDLLMNILVNMIILIHHEQSERVMLL